MSITDSAWPTASRFKDALTFAVSSTKGMLLLDGGARLSRRWTANFLDAARFIL